MNPYLLDFLNTSQASHVVQLKNKIENSLGNSCLNNFQIYWNELRRYFYSLIDSFDVQVILSI